MFTICCFFIIILAGGRGEYLDDNCTLHSGGNGKCILFRQCQSAIQNIQEGTRPQHCGFQGSEPIVCCPKHDEINVSNFKSRKMCEEYKVNAVVPPPPGIVNGLPAEAAEFPHIVALGYDDRSEIQWLCGGSLISKKFILTAAHCIVSSVFGQVEWARMGTVNLKEPYQGGYPLDFKIVNRLPHPDYKPPSVYNDITLLKLNGTVTISKYVQPACINTEFNTLRLAQAIGWGRVQFTGSTSNNLMKVDLEIYSNQMCNKSYFNLSKAALRKGIDNELQVCAGGSINESKDTCQDDSGGPLHTIALETDYAKVYNVIGVTSFGKACGIANIPGVYTRVSYFVPWIENIVWP